MKSTVLGAIALSASLLFSAPAMAGPDDFATGPLIEAFGAVTNVDVEMTIPEGVKFRVAFDVADQADAGEVNRNLVSAARFLNMHVAHGVPTENINIAIVIHGGAVHDITNDAHYTALTDEENAMPPS